MNQRFHSSGPVRALKGNVGVVISTLLVGSCGAIAQGLSLITKPHRFCGYLRREKQTGRDSVFKTKVSLCGRSANVVGPDVLDQLTEVLTKGDGKFEFKDRSPGTCWLLAVFENREYAAGGTGSLYTTESTGNFVLKTYLD